MRAEERVLQACSRQDPFSPQAWRGDDGARQAQPFLQARRAPYWAANNALCRCELVTVSMMSCPGESGPGRSTVNGQLETTVVANTTIGEDGETKDMICRLLNNFLAGNAE